MIFKTARKIFSLTYIGKVHSRVDIIVTANRGMWKKKLKRRRLVNFKCPKVASKMVMI